MAVRVAINGFGRIGRLAFRQMFDAEGYEVVAINDLTSPKMLAHLLKYDTAQGSFCGKIGENKHTVEATEDSIIVDGKEIKIYAVKDAKDAPWGELNVDVVLECTGFYTSKEKSMAHIQAGAKKVVISAPAGNDLKTIVYSVNEKTLTAEDQVISAASCTTNCLAPMADTLNKTYPIVSGIMTTVHAYTGDQMILDGPQRKGDLRRARAGAQNIVPNSTGAAKAIGLVIPELNGKLIGSAQRVPVPTGSTTILVAVVKGKDVTVESINAAMKAATSESFGYNEDPIVSSDVIGMRYGSLFDATQTMVAKIDDDTYQVQVVSWYDNENSYTSQMVRTIKYFAENCYRAATRFLVDFLELRRITELEEVKPHHIRDLMKEKQDMGSTPRYINDLLKVWRTWFNYLVAESYLEERDNPAKKVKPLRQPRTIIDTFTVDEMRRMIRFYDGTDFLSVRNKTIIMLLFDTGMRCNEMILMEPEDIKPDYILVKHGKGGKERVVPKSPALSKQLMKYRTLRDAYLKEYPSRHKNLFLSKNGKPLTDEAVARMLKH